jgi:hypothetical protein
MGWCTMAINPAVIGGRWRELPKALYTNTRSPRIRVDLSESTRGHTILCCGQYCYLEQARIKRPWKVVSFNGRQIHVNLEAWCR